MPLARIISVSAVAAMSPKPMIASSVRSSKPPATSSALPSRILSTPSSTDTAAVAQAPPDGSSSRSCRRTTEPRGRQRHSAALPAGCRWACSASRLPWYMVCIDVMPPMPVPCVLATRLGCTQRISSVGVKPADRNASTVATMFHSATRSIELAMSWLMPYTVGSNPVGICAPTVRDSFVLRGTRISVPALRVTCQSPLSGTGATPCAPDRTRRTAGRRPRRHHEGEVLVQEHRHQQRRRVIGVDRAVVDELPDAGVPRRCRGSARPARIRRPAHRFRCRTSPAWGRPPT